MKYTIKHTTAFKKAYKRCIKQHLDITLLDGIIKKLANGEPLDKRHHDHELTGNFAGFRECHIKPDWLLLYRTNNDVLILTLVDTGSHSEILNM